MALPMLLKSLGDTVTVTVSFEYVGPGGDYSLDWGMVAILAGGKLADTASLSAHAYTTLPATAAWRGASFSTEGVLPLTLGAGVYKLYAALKTGSDGLGTSVAVDAVADITVSPTQVRSATFSAK